MSIDKKSRDQRPVDGELDSAEVRGPVDYTDKNRSVRIHEDGSLFMRGSPGGHWYDPRGDGTYRHRFFILGGNGGGDRSADEVAKKIWRIHRGRDARDVLVALGWSDVITAFDRFEADEQDRELQQIADSLPEIQQSIEATKRHIEEHKDHDYDWWFQHFLQQDISAPGFNPDDYSIRRLCWKADFAAHGMPSKLAGEQQRLRAAQEIVSDKLSFPVAYFDTRFKITCPALSLPRNFVIISGYATTGQSWTDRKNRAADTKLRKRINGFGVWNTRAIGFDVNSGHEEPGWAVDLPLDATLELGREFLQHAIFRVADGHINVVLCEKPTFRIPVGRLCDRVDDARGLINE